MTDLSPAAQAVLDAMSEWFVVDDDERQALAAALRAAVAHTQQHHGLGVWECDADELLAIAAELETFATETND
jgi:ribulose-5-phosphate 4-epimerase/fuculose-1-phosphate aldolase